ncbi:hypothetical protein O2W18_06545 [Modestobacter sp. VKM Ac-2983]|uniref:hypothetical protein n=1 Tax=Modestobacter sp. VKM Ac-2983 TaxID=3004137 RepID=UPI0022AB8B74|nr:hypothetical protein [Modestobacter sp. VKM Ac-2983]MCZ2804750.1 hypothetical protein [Modestobacter sp. VKM Ac-2983]
MSSLAFSRTRTLISVSVIVLLIGIGFLAQALEADEWHWDDWAAMASSVLLSALFFLLARSIDLDSEQRAAAQQNAVRELSQTIANAQLMSTVGSLQRIGSRTLAGVQEQALRISADSLAALEHFSNASEAGLRRQLIMAIETAYTNLAFSALSRGTMLPRFMWTQIRQGAGEVRKRLEQIGTHYADLLSEEDERSLNELTSHIACVMETADRLRRRGLYATAPDDKALAPEVTIAELRCLYRHELAVYHDWRVLSGENVKCRVELWHASDIGDWHTPWYIKPSDGGWVPTNFNGEDLNEEAKWDKIELEHPLPVHPEPLSVREVPPGMRSRGISRMARLVEEQMNGIISVLVYELADADENGALKREGSPTGEGGSAAEEDVSKRAAPRMILDGNHRALAAYRLAASPASEDRSDGPFVITYVIKEQRSITTEGSTARWKGMWRGFTPDIDKLRVRIESVREQRATS